MEYGDRDGHGLHGQVTVTVDRERVVCHECGVERRALGLHLKYLHDGMTVVEYRRLHGLSTGTALVAPATSARYSAHALSYPASLEALWVNAATDGWKSMTVEGQHRPQRVAIRKATGARSRLGRQLTEEEIATLEAAPTVAAWTAAARVIVEQGGTSIAAMARATGMSKSTVRDRLRSGMDKRHVSAARQSLTP